MAKTPRKPRRLLGPKSWVSLVPNGIGFTKPNHYLEMAKIAWRNRDELPYAWRILNDGCCDGCALGTTGMRDWTMDDHHLCLVRLQMLRLNTVGAMDERLLADPAALRSRSSKELRELGRLPYPMVWRRGEPGYRRVSWDEALDLAAERVRATAERDPDRLSFYLTSRGIPNETYFAVQKVARFLGTNNVDNSARLCHAPSTVALEQTIGWGATTNTYADWIGSDLIVLAGTNLANNQPVAMKYLYMAKKAGTRIVVVNPYLEDGLERYWVPSSPESALFGTKMLDDFFQVQHGGDAAFFSGALKHIFERGMEDRDFVERHTSGIEELRESVAALDWRELEASSGLTEQELRRFGDIYAQAKTSITVWSMGITQHAHGTQNVLAISNLALALGRVGVPGSGLNPIRGHSGVQGGAEMGAVPSGYGMGRKVVDDDAAAAVSAAWGFEVPRGPGLNATASLHAMHRGEIDVLYALGGDFLETLPDPAYVEQALRRVPVRVHQDLVVTPMMLVEPEDASILLPAATRYETPGGVTETSTERRVIFSPEIPGRRIAEARSEWEIAVEIAKRARPWRRTPDRLRWHRRHPPRHRTHRRGVRADRAPRREGRPVPVGRRAPGRGRALQHLGRPRALRRAEAARRRGPGGLLPRLDAPRQAVQQHGLGRPRRAHRRAPRPGLRLDRGRRTPRDLARRSAAAALRGRRVPRARARHADARRQPPGALARGQRAARAGRRRPRVRRARLQRRL